MLHAHKIVTVEIQETGGLFVGTQILLRKLKSHLVEILIARVRIIYWNGKEAFRTILGAERCTEIGRKMWQSRTHAADNFQQTQCASAVGGGKPGGTSSIIGDERGVPAG